MNVGLLAKARVSGYTRHDGTRVRDYERRDRPKSVVTQGFRWRFGQRRGLFDLPDIDPPVLIGDILTKQKHEIHILAMRRLNKIREENENGRQLRNKDTGWNFVIGRLDWGKIAKDKSRPISHFRSIFALRRLVSRAVLAESHNDDKHTNPHVRAVHRFYAPLVIGDALYRVKLTVKDYLLNDGSGRANLHALEAVEIEKSEPTATMTRRTGQGKITAAGVPVSLTNRRNPFGQGMVMTGKHDASIAQSGAPMGTSLTYSGNELLRTDQPTSARRISIARLLRNARRNDGKPFVSGVALLKKSFDSFVVGADCVLRFPSGSVLAVEGEMNVGLLAKARVSGYTRHDGTRVRDYERRDRPKSVVTQGFRWRFGQRRGLFDLPDIVVSSITGNEFGRTREEMRSNALLHLSMFPIDGAKNKDTGWMLVMAKDDKKRLVYQSGNPYAFSAIYALESLVSRAILAESHEDFVNKNPDVQAIHNFFAPLEIGGRLYRVKLIVRDYKGEGSGEKTKLRAIAAVEIGSVLPGLHTLRETHAESAQPTTGRSVSIALLLKDARRNDGKPFVPGAALLKKSFDSFVVGAECVLRFPSGSVLVVEGGASCPWCSRIGHV